MIAPDPLDTRTAGPADDSGDGLLMFFVFIAAVLTSTGAVALIALAGTWWVLGLGFAIHAVVTALVVLTIVHVMAGRVRLTAERDRPRPAPDARPGARRSGRTGPATAL
jgi:membrane protein implicated in regulation of membrane protease activity